MTPTFFNRILLITIISFPALLNAEQSDNAYQGNVVVESFDENTLQQMALKQVLVKVSGNVDIVTLEETTLLLNKTQQMLSQYRYHTYQAVDYFSAVFDKRKVNQAIKDMQQPVWGDTRPTTLIWLVKGNKLISDHVIKQANDSILSLSLQEAESQRGIKVQFPLMDLDDNLALSVSDIKGRFYEQVANASSRYERPHFVLAELKAINSEKWKLSWELIQTNKDAKLSNVLISEKFVGEKSVVITNMVNQLADYYASQYAILENQDEKFTQLIYVNGINSLGQLTKLNSVLGNLFAIASFSIVATEGELLTIEVKINGGLNSFKNALRVQPHLQLDTSLSVTPEILPESTDVQLENTETDNNEVNNIETEVVSADALYFNWR